MGKISLEDIIESSNYWESPFLVLYVAYQANIISMDKINFYIEYLLEKEESFAEQYPDIVLLLWEDPTNWGEAFKNSVLSLGHAINSSISDYNSDITKELALLYLKKLLHKDGDIIFEGITDVSSLLEYPFFIREINQQLSDIYYYSDGNGETRNKEMKNIIEKFVAESNRKMRTIEITLKK